MAITFLGSAVDSEQNNQNDLILTQPSHESGDFALVFAKKNGTSGDLSMDVSWTELFQDDHTAGDNRTNAAYHKRYATNSEPSANVSINQTTQHAAVLGVYRGVNSITPFDVPYTSSTATNSPEPDHVDITTITDDCAIVIFWTYSRSSGVGITPPSGFTLIESIESEFDSNNGLAVAHNLNSGTAGLQSIGSWSKTNSSGQSDSSMYAFALRPVPEYDLDGVGIESTPEIGNAIVSADGMVAGRAIKACMFVGNSDVTHEFSLIGTSLESTPIVGQSGVSHEFDLSGVGIESTPKVEISSVTEMFQLDGISIQSVPELEQANLTFNVDLLGDAISASPVVEVSSITHEFTLNGIDVTSTPETGYSRIMADGEIAGHDIETDPIVGLGVVTPSYNLVGDGIKTVPQISIETVTHNFQINTTTIESTFKVSQGSITPDYILSGNGIKSTITAPSGNITPKYDLSVIGVKSTPEVSVSSITPGYTLFGNGIVSTPTLETPIITSMDLGGMDIITTPNIGLGRVIPTLSGRGIISDPNLNSPGDSILAIPSDALVVYNFDRSRIVGRANIYGSRHSRQTRTIIGNQ